MHRIFHHNIWFRGAHNNMRYDALLPRFSRVDNYLSICSGPRIVRGAKYRMLRATERLRNRALFDAAARRYRFAFCTGPAQVPWFSGKVVVDVDDPKMTYEEAALLGRRNVEAYVVTAESAARQLEAMGLEKPFHVIPQPVRLDLLDQSSVSRVGAILRPSREFVVGYVAAWLLSEGDRGAENPLFNVDHLLELWDHIRVRVPGARLCLIGQPGERLRRRCGAYDDIRLTGRLAPAEVVAHVANFDVSVYPRQTDTGIRAVKLAEYMALGVPSVAYAHQTTRDLTQLGAGVVVESPREFVDAVATLATDQAKRESMARAARAAGAHFDVRLIAHRYEHEVLDRYLA
jgi:glycosyltransferase involved in cell wall biosynthesis